MELSDKLIALCYCSELDFLSVEIRLFSNATANMINDFFTRFSGYVEKHYFIFTPEKFFRRTSPSSHVKRVSLVINFSPLFVIRVVALAKDTFSLSHATTMAEVFMLEGTWRLSEERSEYNEPKL